VIKSDAVINAAYFIPLVVGEKPFVCRARGCGGLSCTSGATEVDRVAITPP